MNSVPKICRWQKGKVDRTKEHFELRYGSAWDSDWNGWTPIAVIGRPKRRIVNVEFLVDCAERENAKAVHDVEEDIQFYLIDKEEPNPWGYAQYHCGTGSNTFSPVHWAFFKVRTAKRD